MIYNNNDFCNNETVRIFKPIERNEDGMSFMTAIINEKGCVIAADSMMKAGTEIYTDFQKIFYTDDMIWGVVGNYGVREKYLKKINEIITNSQKMELLMNIKDTLSTIGENPNVTLNIFLCAYDKTPILYIIDLFKGSVSVEKVKVGAYCAGSLEYMKSIFKNINQISQFDLKTMKEKSIQTIKSAIEIDNFIFDRNPFYEVSVGGNISYIAMDNKNNKEININN